jgi:hypothetical protein
MKRMIPLVVSLAGLALFAQVKDKSRISIADLAEERLASPAVEQIRVAQREILIQQDRVRQVQEQAKTDPQAAAQAQRELQKLEDAQKALQATAKTAKAVPIVYVSAGQRQHLTDLVEQFYEDVKSAEASASALALGMVVASLGFGLASAILSIMSWNKAAAVASACVVVAGGIPKVFPIQERAAYYSTLANQSYSLRGNLQIPYQMTATEYDDGVAKLRILQDYRATRYPSSRDVQATTQDLLKELTAAAAAQAQ